MKVCLNFATRGWKNHLRVVINTPSSSSASLVFRISDRQMCETCWWMRIIIYLMWIWAHWIWHSYRKQFWIYCRCFTRDSFVYAIFWLNICAAELGGSVLLDGKLAFYLVFAVDVVGGRWSHKTALHNRRGAPSHP